MNVRHRNTVHRSCADDRDGEAAVIEQLRKGLAEAGLDRRCEEEANQVFAKLDRIRRAGALEDARRMRDAIAIVMVLLAELDEMTADERDLTSFEEIASLFNDIADYAARGAAFSRMLAFRPEARPGASVQ